MIYEKPIALTGDILKQRIFSPLAYPATRHANVVAIALSEVPRYAVHYPIAWRVIGQRHELVVLRSLLPDGRGHLPGSQTTLSFAPTMIRAYPIMYPPADTFGNGAHKFIDAAAPDEPADVGAPIAHADGRPSSVTLQRIALLDAAAASFAKSATVTAELARADLFEPWPLHFENVEDQTLDVEGLWILRQSAAQTGAFASLMRAHGLAAADLVGLHRLSLFRTGALLTQARHDLARSRAAPADQMAELRA